MSSAPLPMVTTAFIITVWPVRSKRSLRRTVCLRITSCSDAMAQLGEREPVQRLLAGDALVVPPAQPIVLVQRVAEGLGADHLAGGDPIRMGHAEDPLGEAVVGARRVGWRPLVSAACHLILLLFSVVHLLLLCRWDVADLGVQAAVVPPVDVLERGELDLLRRLPRPLAGDELGLVEADRGLSHGADAPIAVKRPPRGLWTLPEGVASAPRSRVRETASNSG